MRKLNGFRPSTESIKSFSFNFGRIVSCQYCICLPQVLSKLYFYRFIKKVSKPHYCHDNWHPQMTWTYKVWQMKEARVTWWALFDKLMLIIIHCVFFWTSTSTSPRTEVQFVFPNSSFPCATGKVEIFPLPMNCPFRDLKEKRLWDCFSHVSSLEMDLTMLRGSENCLLVEVLSGLFSQLCSGYAPYVIAFAIWLQQTFPVKTEAQKRPLSQCHLLSFISMEHEINIVLCFPSASNAVTEPFPITVQDTLCLCLFSSCPQVPLQLYSNGAWWSELSSIFCELSSLLKVKYSESPTTPLTFPLGQFVLLLSFTLYNSSIHQNFQLWILFSLLKSAYPMSILFSLLLVAFPFISHRLCNFTVLLEGL